jgi:hypothetical protein
LISKIILIKIFLASHQLSTKSGGASRPLESGQMQTTAIEPKAPEGRIFLPLSQQWTEDAIGFSESGRISPKKSDFYFYFKKFTTWRLNTTKTENSIFKSRFLCLLL